MNLPSSVDPDDYITQQQPEIGERKLVKYNQNINVCNVCRRTSTKQSDHHMNTFNLY